MNLAVSGQSHVAAAVAAVNNASTLDTSALLYQQNDHHQQQPISYKIPQVRLCKDPSIVACQMPVHLTSTI